MQTTMNLLERALTVHTMAEWTRRLALSKNAISEAKRSGHLPPVMAGGLALELEEDPREWMTQAVIEGEKESPAKATLARRLASWRKRLLSIIEDLMTWADARDTRCA